MNSRNSLSIILVAANLFCSLVWAGDTQQANSDAKEFAKGINSGLITDTVNNIDPESIPNYEGTDIPEVDYYDRGLEIENDAQEASLSNETAIFMQGGIDSRPQVTIDVESDPMFKRYDEISTKANSLSASYAGCVDLPVGTEDVTKYEEKICHTYGSYIYSSDTCYVEYTATCNRPTSTKTYDLKIMSQGRKWITVSVNFNTGSWQAINPSDGDRKYAAFAAWGFSNVCSQNTTTITYLGYEFWPDGIGNVGSSNYDTSAQFRVLQHPSCANGLIGKYQIEDNSGGSSTSYALGAIYKYRLNMTKNCTPTYTTTTTCNSGSSHPSQYRTNRTCLSSGYRVINGQNIYRGCWKYKDDYSIPQITYSESAECQDHRNSGCGYVGSTCLNRSSSGHCLDEELRFSCPYLEAARWVSLCGSELVCPDGSCAEDVGREEVDGTDDFKKAATGLAVASELADGINLSEIAVFNGKDLSCKTSVASAYDCCQDGGWADDLGLSSCNSEEKQLGLQKDASQTIYVGRKSNYNGLGIKISTTKKYCTYPSKLARMIIEQGKAQLGQDFGTYDNPDCEGFSMDEIQYQLDFNAMDFSEYYSDVMDSANNGTTPSSSNALDSIQNKLKATYPDMDMGE